MIQEFTANNYGCLEDVTVRLTKLHALIGPNDSGKSTMLRGIRVLCSYAAREPDLGQFNGSPPIVIPSKISLGATIGSDAYYSFYAANGAFFENYAMPGLATYDRNVSERSSVEPRVVDAFAPAFLLRADPDAMRATTPLIAGARIAFDDERGRGLASVIDAIRDRSETAYAEMTAEFRRLFPAVKNLQLIAYGASGKKVHVELHDGTRVPADRMSEGMLYYLVIASLRHVDRVRTLLIEEPENGLHPARVADVMRILRAISETGTQVIVATHSPLVVNELKPDEVTLFTRREREGTRVLRMDATRNFEERSKVYALGELWLSYANGVDESDLVEREPAVPV